jgi:predicted nucleotidyltransferase
MTHEERLALAEEIKKIVIEKYGDKVEFFAVLGSTVRNEDTEHSDLEMIAVVNTDVSEKDISFIYQEHFVHIWIISKEDVLKKATKINLNWPLVNGTFYNFKLLHGTENVVREVKQAISNLSDADFAPTISESILSLYENMGKIKAAELKGRNELANLDTLVYRLALKIGLILSLVNRTPIYGSSYKAFETMHDFPKLPSEFKETIEKIVVTDKREVKIALSQNLFDSFLVFMKNEGFNIRSYSSLVELGELKDKI